MSTPPANLRAQRVAVVGLLVNIALAGVKLVAGLVGHSYALVADAVESMTDILGSVVIWGGLRIGARPADENHPWGHGKAESLAALVVAAMVLAAGIGIGIKSIDEIITPHHGPAPFTLVVLVVVVVVKELLFRRVLRIAREEESGAAEVDAWHHRSDAITSAAAFIGISIALFGERLFGGAAAASGAPSRWASADDYAALLASAVIIYNGWRLMRVPLRDLMDEEGPHATGSVIGPARDTAMAVPGVLDIEKVRARRSGSRWFLEMHVEVDPAMPVREAHAVGGRVRAAVRGRVPRVADVLVHVEPHEGGDERGPANRTPSE
ncbi:MAG: cation transporter [Phycisphaeraceae bacterium]|nr:cation transporter [Phycisphaeraceae bacterium]